MNKKMYKLKYLVSCLVMLLISVQMMNVQAAPPTDPSGTPVTGTGPSLQAGALNICLPEATPGVVTPGRFRYNVQESNYSSYTRLYYQVSYWDGAAWVTPEGSFLGGFNVDDRWTHEAGTSSAIFTFKGWRTKLMTFLWIGTTSYIDITWNEPGTYMITCMKGNPDKPSMDARQSYYIVKVDAGDPPAIKDVEYSNKMNPAPTNGNKTVTINSGSPLVFAVDTTGIGETTSYGGYRLALTEGSDPSLVTGFSEAAVYGGRLDTITTLPLVNPSGSDITFSFDFIPLGLAEGDCEGSFTETFTVTVKSQDEAVAEATVAPIFICLGEGVNIQVDWLSPHSPSADYEVIYQMGPDAANLEETQTHKNQSETSTTIIAYPQDVPETWIWVSGIKMGGTTYAVDHMPTRVTVFSGPEADITYIPTNICEDQPFSVVLSRTDASSDTAWVYDWEIVETVSGTQVLSGDNKSVGEEHPVDTLEITPNTLKAGTSYTFKVKALANNGTINKCVNSDNLPSKVFTVNALPTATLTADGESLCVGSDLEFTITRGSEWVSGQSWSYLLANAYGDTIHYKTVGTQFDKVTWSDFSADDTIYVNLINAAGCEVLHADSFFVDVVTPPNATIGTASGDDAVCGEDSVRLTVIRTDDGNDGEFGFTDWTIYYSVAGTAYTVDANAKTFTFIPEIQPEVNETMTYQLDSIVDNLSGCKGFITSQYASATRYPRPEVEILADNTVLCNDDTVTFTITRTDDAAYLFGDTYKWSIDYQIGAGVKTNQVFTEEVVVLKLAIEGIDETSVIPVIFSALTDSLTGCEVADLDELGTPWTDTTKITVNPLPEISFEIDKETICEGDTVHFVVPREDKGTTGDWTVWYSIHFGTDVENKSFENLNTDTLRFEKIFDVQGNYMLMIDSVQNNETGCITRYYSEDWFKIITVNPIPTVAFEMPKYLCSNENLTWEVARTDAGENSDYTNWMYEIWKLDAAGEYELFKTISATDSLDVYTGVPLAASAVHSDTTHIFRLVMLKDNKGGCEAYPDSASMVRKVTVLPIPEIEITGIDTICAGDSVELTVTRVDPGEVGKWAFSYVVSGNKKDTIDVEVTAASFTTIKVGPFALNDTVTVIELMNDDTRDCENLDPVEFPIFVHAVPAITVAADGLKFCEDDTVTFTVTRLDTESMADWTYIYEVSGPGIETLIDTVDIADADFSVIKMPFALADGTGTTNITFEVTDLVNNVTGCIWNPTDTLLVNKPDTFVTINEKPKLEITELRYSPVCGPDAKTVGVYFERIDGNTSYDYVIEYEIVNTDGRKLDTYPVNTKTGNFEVPLVSSHTYLTIFKVTDNITGCVNSDTLGTEIRRATIDPVAVEDTLFFCAGEETDDIALAYIGDSILYTWGGGADLGLEDNTTEPQAFIPSFVTKVTPLQAVTKREVLVTPWIETTPGSGNYDCSGSVVSLWIQVNPMPELDMPLADTTICSGDVTPARDFAGFYTGLTWKNIGELIPSSVLDGRTNLSTTALGEIEIVNTTDTIKVIAIEVTMRNFVTINHDACEVIDTCYIYVNPEPIVVTDARDYELCNGDGVVVDYDGSVYTEIRWQAIASSNITIYIDDVALTYDTVFAPETLLTLDSIFNTGIDVDSVLLISTPYYINDMHPSVICAGAEDTVTIFVNPQPIVNDIAHIDICEIGEINVTPTGVATHFDVKIANNTIENNVFGGEDYEYEIEAGEAIFFEVENKTDRGQKADFTVTPKWLREDGEWCYGDSTTFTVHVLPTPVVAATKTVADELPGVDQLVYCAGDVVEPYHFYGTTHKGIVGEDETGYTQYRWNRILGHAQDTLGYPEAGLDSIEGFIAENTTNEPIQITYKVVPTYYQWDWECEGPEKLFYITINPTPVIAAIDTLYYNNGETANRYLFESSVTAVSYTWEQTGGDVISGNLATSGVGHFPAFQAVNKGNTPLTAEFTLNASYANAGVTCPGEPVKFYITVLPSIEIAAGEDLTYCDGDEIAEGEVTFTSNIANAQYKWLRTGGNAIGIESGTGDFVGTVVNAGTIALTATYTVTPYYVENNVEVSGTPYNFSVTVNPATIMDVEVIDSVVIAGTDVYVQFTSDQTGFIYTWLEEYDVTPAGIGNPFTMGSGQMASFVAKNESADTKTANYIAYASFANSLKACPSDEVEFSISVLPVPAMNMNVLNDRVFCADASNREKITFSATTLASKTTYNVESSVVGGTLDFVADADSITFNTTNIGNTPIVATFEVTPIFTDKGVIATGATETFTVIINPTPVITAVENKVFSAGDEVQTIEFATNVEGAAINWTATGDAIGLNAANGTAKINRFTAINASDSTATATVTVSASYSNAGLTCNAADTKSFTISVLPKPVLNIDLSDKVYCADNEEVSISLTSEAAAAKTTYSVAQVSVEGTLAYTYDATAKAINFTPVNTGSAPIIVKFQVTPEFTDLGVTSVGTTEEFTVTVNPNPVIAAVADMVVADGTWISDFSLESNVSGADFTWTATDADAIGMASSGSGSTFYGFTAANTSDDTKAATVTVSASYSNAGLTCNAADTKSFTISVLPKPVLNIDLSDKVYCADNAEVAIYLTSTAAIAKTTYSVTPVNVAGTLAYTYDATAKAIKFTPANAGSAPIVVKFQVTPVFTDLGVVSKGETKEFTVTVNPKPVITAVSNIVTTNNSEIAAIAFASSVNGAVFTWSATGDDIGLANISGTGNISRFTAKNATTASKTATITVDASYTNAGATCNAAATVPFTIKVLPTPAVNTVLDLTVCAGETVDAISFAGNVTGAEYVWKQIGGVDINLPTATNNTLAAFEAKNTGIVPVSATIEVTPQYTEEGVTSYGKAITFTITVNPVPAAPVVVASEVYCNNTLVPAYSFAGSTAPNVNVEYAWYREDATASFCGVPASGVGNFPQFTAVNNGTAEISATYKVKAVSKYSTACESGYETFTITILPTAKVDAIEDIVVFHGKVVAADAIAITGTPAGAVMKWEWIGGSQIGAALSGTGNFPTAEFTAQNNTNAPVVATYQVTAYNGANDMCAGESRTFSVTVNPDFTFTLSKDYFDVDFYNIGDVIVPYEIKAYNDVELSVEFDAAALAAGFKNINSTILPTDGSFVIGVPENAPVGTYTATVTVKQGENVRTQTITIVVNAQILLDGVAWDGDVNYEMNCGATTLDIQVNATTDVSYTVNKPSSFAKAGVHPVKVTLTNNVDGTVKVYSINVERREDFNKLVLNQFNSNTLVVINNPEQTGYAEFKAYQWYRSGTDGNFHAIQGATEQYYSAGSSGASLDDGEYYVEITTVNGEKFRTCAGSINTAQSSAAIKAYPNPVERGAQMRVLIDDADAKTIDVYSVAGVFVGTYDVTGAETVIELRNAQTTGVYVLRVRGAEGIVNGELKFIVK